MPASGMVTIMGFADTNSQRGGRSGVSEGAVQTVASAATS